MRISLANPSSTTPPLPAILPLAKLASLLRAAVVATALCGLGLVVAITGADLDDAAEAAKQSNGPVYLPRAEYLRPMSLGWQNVLADVLWFDTISYFGEHFRSDRTYPWLAQMCDLITDLDPRAEHVYRFAGFILPWEADQADAGVRLLEKGARQFPDSWLLQYYIGFHYYFFKNDYARAVTHLRRAMQLPGAHPSVAGLVAVLSAEHYGPDTTLAFLAELERSVDSADVRELVRQNMRDMQLSAALNGMTAATRAFYDRFGFYPLTADDMVTAGVVDSAPADPYGGEYIIDLLSGEVRSSTGHQPTRLHQSPMRQQRLSQMKFAEE